MLNVFVLNPKAGKKQDFSAVEREIRQLFEGREDEFRVEYTQYAGHAKVIAKKYAESGEPVRLYACGGDGTLFEVVNGAYGFDNAEVAPVPKGSGNDFVKLYDKERRATIAEMIEGEAHSVDVIRCDHEISLNCFSAGLDADVAGMIAKMKKVPFVSGSLAYILAAAIKIVRNKKYRMAFEIDGEIHEEEKLLFAAAMNGRFYGGGFNPSPEAVLDDGFFDLVRVKAMSYIDIAGLVGKYKNGTHFQHDKKGLISLTRCKKIKIMSPKPLLVTLDGEMRLKTSPEIEMIPHGINIVFPKWAAEKPDLLTKCKKDAVAY